MRTSCAYRSFLAIVSTQSLVAYSSLVAEQTLHSNQHQLRSTSSLIDMMLFAKACSSGFRGNVASFNSFLICAHNAVDDISSAA